MSINMLPTHPLTGRRALGWRKPRRSETGDQPIWPIAGAEDTPPADDPPPGTDKGFPENTPVSEMSVEQQAAYWKDKARKHEDRVKSLNPAEIEQLREKSKKFDELTESQKSEVEKALERARQAEEKATEVEVRALRAEVAAAKGVPASLLSGSTKEQLEAAADELIAFKGQQKPDFGGGHRGGDVGGVKQWTKADMAGKSAAEINAARKAGHLDHLMGKTP